MEKSVLVTGAGDSVGRLIAERYLSKGAKVHICDVRKDALNNTLKANPGMRGTIANVGKEEDVDILFSEIFSWMDYVNILINMVGISGPSKTIDEISCEEWRETINVNLHGMFYCIRKVVPKMKKRNEGCIINFSSASTRTCIPNRSPYVVSKYGVEGLTRNIARELGPYNIRCNAILPGGIKNERNRKIIQRLADTKRKSFNEVYEECLKYISMRTFIDPKELVDIVMYLTSDQAPHITGQLIGVDGNQEWED